jgi:putative endonuclease
MEKGLEGFLPGFWTYIVASAPYGTLYIGSTSDLKRRSREHRGGYGSRFASRYAVGVLVWLQEHDSLVAAEQQERTMKGWPRRWKINVIEAENPSWMDLSKRL